MNLKLNCLDNVKGPHNSTSVEESKKLHESQTSAKVSRLEYFSQHVLHKIYIGLQSTINHKCSGVKICICNQLIYLFIINIFIQIAEIIMQLIARTHEYILWPPLEFFANVLSTCTCSLLHHWGYQYPWHHCMVTQLR